MNTTPTTHPKAGDVILLGIAKQRWLVREVREGDGWLVISRFVNTKQAFSGGATVEAAGKGKIFEVECSS